MEAYENVVQDEKRRSSEERAITFHQPAWIMERDGKRAAQLFRDAALTQCRHMGSLSLTLNMLGTVEKRHRSIIKFYQTPDVEWASHFICHLEGDRAVGEGVKRHVLTTIMEALQTGFCLEEGTRKLLLFEGEEDHLIPSCRLDLIEDGLFITAGRIMGHSFLHGGPSFTGLSPTILDVILGGDPKRAIPVADCADIEVREVLEMLEGTAILTEDQRMRVNHICMSWDMPEVDRENRKWLYEKILHHAVLGRTAKQVEQLERGLTDSGVYDLLSARPDTAAILFPRTSEREITPQMILDHITWPAEVADGVSPEDQDRILSFLRRFIENGTPDVLKSLLRFWTGWEVLSGHLKVEVIPIKSSPSPSAITRHLPQSATCFFTLKLPAGVQEFEQFTIDLKEGCETSYSGFGQY